jgi:hypothetical protein
MFRSATKGLSPRLKALVSSRPAISLQTLLALKASIRKIATAPANGAKAHQPPFRKNRSVLASGPLA